MRKLLRVAYSLRGTPRCDLREYTLYQPTAGSADKNYINRITKGAAIMTGVLNSLTQIRHLPTVGNLNTCWNCHEVVMRKNQMICDKCGILQDVDSEISYFELLDFPKTFKLESQELTQRFRQLQSRVHPDKYSNKTTREQVNSADWSSLINKAYKTLLLPIERGQYILYLHGLKIPQDNSALDKEFLMEMMERNEEVEEAKSEENLLKLHEQISADLDEKTVELRKKFDDNDLDAVTSLLVKMKYLHSIQKSIKKKMQDMLSV